MAKQQAHTLRLHFDGLGGTPMVAATVEGIVGPGCSQASAWLNNLGTVKLDLHTEDFYADEDTDTDSEVDRELALA